MVFEPKWLKEDKPSCVLEVNYFDRTGEPERNSKGGLMWKVEDEINLGSMVKPNKKISQFRLFT